MAQKSEQVFSEHCKMRISKSNGARMNCQIRGFPRQLVEETFWEASDTKGWRVAHLLGNPSRSYKAVPGEQPPSHPQGPARPEQEGPGSIGPVEKGAKGPRLARRIPTVPSLCDRNAIPGPRPWTGVVSVTWLQPITARLPEPIPPTEPQVAALPELGLGARVGSLGTGLTHSDLMTESGPGAGELDPGYYCSLTPLPSGEMHRLEKQEPKRTYVWGPSRYLAEKIAKIGTQPMLCGEFNN